MMFGNMEILGNERKGIQMLKGKTVILGVTGSIAAYKTAYLASMLVKLRCEAVSYTHLTLPTN